MKASINSNLIHIVILDISGIYAQIHNQGYFEKDSINDIKEQYADAKHWKVIVLDNL